MGMPHLALPPMGLGVPNLGPPPPMGSTGAPSPVGQMGANSGMGPTGIPNYRPPSMGANQMGLPPMGVPPMGTPPLGFMQNQQQQPPPNPGSGVLPPTSSLFPDSSNT